MRQLCLVKVGIDFVRQLTTKTIGEELTARIAEEGLQHRPLYPLGLIRIWSVDTFSNIV